ncbi:MAG TPA: SDR family NAD(P)-dependent oxidoreductase [Streptosporangiaceae bacterium]|nr:SDR family NAD(P)-dependent oxidoreductase [Streptosporangiaceae bacterium]
MRVTSERAATAIVTGGTGGLGAAVTRRFLDASWRTVVPWYHERELERLDSHPRLTLVQADLFDPTSAAACVAEGAADSAAPLAAVVNLVGGFAIGGRMHETPIDDFERQLRLNLRPAYLTCQAALPHLIAGGGGSIVCVSSRAAVRPFPGAVGYVTSKAAVLALVDALAVEYRDDGVRANAVLPSVIDTPGNRASQPDADYSRWVRPEEIAEVIFGLCAGSEIVSGAHIPVYGRA